MRSARPHPDARQRSRRWVAALQSLPALLCGLVFTNALFPCAPAAAEHFGDGVVARFRIRPRLPVVNHATKFRAKADDDPRAFWWQDWECEDCTYHWHFGDGTQANGRVVYHTYTEVAEDVKVTLKVRDGDGPGDTVTITKYIAVVEPLEESPEDDKAPVWRVRIHLSPLTGQFEVIRELEGEGIND